MENTYLIGLSRQMALQRELDVVANNVANLNTGGFKAESVAFERYLMPTASAGAFDPADRTLQYVQDRGTWHDFSQGAVQRTGNSLDVALEANGFLVVETPRGERYTRNGALQLNAAGELVTTEGFRVLGDAGAITFQAGDQDIAIAADGTVSVPGGGRGKIRVVNFDQPQRLRKDGLSTFSAPAGVQANVVQTPKLVQGAVEKSNVNGVAEMTRLIEVSRAYQSIAGLLQSQGDMRRTAIERLAEVPA